MNRIEDATRWATLLVEDVVPDDVIDEVTYWEARRATNWAVSRATHEATDVATWEAVNQATHTKRPTNRLP